MLFYGKIHSRCAKGKVKMNLLELNRLKRRLKFEKYLCSVMAFMTLIGASKELKNNINTLEIKDDVRYECINEIESRSVKQSIIDESLLVYATEPMKQELSEVTVPKLQPEPEEIAVIEPAELTYEEKMFAIMEREGYTYDELDAVCAGCVAESCGDPNCYNEAYNTASTFNNRTHSLAFVNDVSRIFGENTGYSIYYQFIAPNQFSVWSNGNYKKYLGRIDLVGYQAAIDMFYSGIPSHNYLNFNYIPDKHLQSYQLDEGHNGNYFCRELKEEDRLDDETVLKLVLEIED